MPTSSPAEILLLHNEWANRQMLAACDKLTREQFHHAFEMGPGSPHNAMTHILGAMRGWGDMLAGREQRPKLEADPQRTPAELLMLHDEIAADFGATARAHPLEEIVVAQRGGKSYSFTRGGVITHVMTHGMHHRAQMLNMLRHLGMTPLPQSAVLEWIKMVDFAGEAR